MTVCLYTKLLCHYYSSATSLGHPVYDPVALQAAVANVDVPEFLPQSANPYYRLPTGSQSPYGDLLILMLESLVASKGMQNTYTIS